MLTITSNIRDVEMDLGAMQRQLPFAISLAVNRTAQDVKKGIRNEMVKVFDRPTPYTLNALQLTPGKVGNPTAIVWVKSGAEKYLLPQVYGGGREMKRSERWLKSFYVPGTHTKGGGIVGNLLNSYGNLPPKLITEILAYTGNLQDAYSNRSARSMKRNKRWQSFSYFIEWKDGRPIGVMMRRGKGDPRTVLFFIKNPQYKKRLDFFGVGHRIAQTVYDSNMKSAVQYAIATAKKSL